MEWLKVLVICFMFCVYKCVAMSLNEIEEFSNFLEKTSQLDEILKKGTSPDDFDEYEEVSDDAWEESGKFEGDLILNERQRRLIVQDVAEGLSRNGLKDSTKRWPDNEVVYYIQKEHFTGDQMQAIQDGIDDLAQASCVKFRPYRKGDRDAVVIQGSRRGCFSQVGYQGGYQVLNLSGRHPVGRGCFRHGTVVHELLHTLGFYHMQSSPDRDDYIDVKWENIVEPAKHNFRKYNTFSVSDFGVGYDYDSVLHYGRRAFSANGRDTLVPKQSGASIGQRAGLSDKDAKKLNKMYCDADSNNFDADEESIKKPVIKKKTPKNKPFEGHGIGYHQGKTVVIKLPAAETYKLSDESKSHVFDHFSKAPQSVPPTTFIQGIGAGEEVTYKYEPVEFNPEEFSRPTKPIVQNRDVDSEQHADYDYSNEDKEPSEPKLNNGINKTAEKEKSSDKDQNEPTGFEKPRKQGDDINDAFDRLGNIIKTHVYPSHTPDLDIYKTKDYNEFYNPERKFEPEPEIVKVDKAFSSPLSSDSANNKGLKTKEKIADHEIKKQFEEFIEKTVYEPSIPKSASEDSTYGTGYPLKLMHKIKDEKLPTPEYATRKYLSQKHDYSQLYEPTDYNSTEKTKSKAFGYIVPLQGVYRNNDLKKDNLKYDLDQYTHEVNNDRGSLKLLQLEPKQMKEALHSELPNNKPSYTLFGVIVPLTQKWYRFNFDPHKGSFVIEQPHSTEDYR